MKKKMYIFPFVTVVCGQYSVIPPAKQAHHAAKHLGKTPLTFQDI